MPSIRHALLILGILLALEAGPYSNPNLAAPPDAAKAPHPVTNPSSPVMLSGSWAPADHHQINFDKLPRVPVAHIVISDVHATRGVNQHNYLVHHDGRFWAMWSDGPEVEDRVGQVVKYSTSIDGLKWDAPKFITPYPRGMGPDSPLYNTRKKEGFRYIARGFWVREGQLLALASLDEAAGFFGPSLALHAFRWNPTKSVWDDAGVVHQNTINNFPPEKLPNGQWAMSRRTFDYQKTTGAHFLVGGVKSLDDWQSFPIVPDKNSRLKAEEPVWWTLPDGNLVSLFRDNSRSGYLYRAFSTDQGRTWSLPTKTDFPDATSKLHGLRLKDGQYVLVSNPHPKRRDPLTLAISDDGLVFTKLFYVVGGRWVDYPQVMEHDGYLYIAHSGDKRSVEVERVRIADLAGIAMTPLPAAKPNDAARQQGRAIPASTEDDFAVVVLGGTPGGIAAAIAAARQGHSVALVEEHDHIGGMITSGLGKSDVENRAIIGGLFKEFVRRVHAHYVQQYGAESGNVRLCHDGYYSEPSVAEKVLLAMIADYPQITVLTGWRVKSAVVEAGRLKTVEIVNRNDHSRIMVAKVFIDATYEGDLYAASGAEFRLGRESRAQFNEPHAGVVYFDYQSHEFLPGTTGAADERLPAYTYRLCLTTDPQNAARLTKPPTDYDRTRYLGYFDDLKAGRLAGPKVFKPGRGYNPAHFNTLVRALSVTDIPNRKTDVNINPRPLGFPFCEENRGYVTGDAATRQRISDRHRNLTLGLLWFLQNDSEVPEAHRRLANQMHLPKDEFTDNGHFPFQLYVREARRLVGEYTLTEHDITGDGRDRTPRRHPDTVAVGEFPIDSFPARKRQPTDTIVLEGYLGMLDYITRPYEIPYRIMLPKKIDGLLVPVAASTTHVAFSSIRMEPTWMVLGQAAGTAAHLAIEHRTTPRRVPVRELQQLLRKQGQVLEHAPRQANP